VDGGLWVGGILWGAALASGVVGTAAVASAIGGLLLGAVVAVRLRSPAGGAASRHSALWSCTSVGRPSRNRSKAATESSKAKVSLTKRERSTASLAARSIAFWYTFA